MTLRDETDGRKIAVEESETLVDGLMLEQTGGKGGDADDVAAVEELHQQVMAAVQHGHLEGTQTHDPFGGHQTGGGIRQREGVAAVGKFQPLRASWRGGVGECSEPNPLEGCDVVNSQREHRSSRFFNGKRRGRRRGRGR